MSDEVPSGRLSQIFNPLTNLQQPNATPQQHHRHRQQHQPHQGTLARPRSTSSSPSPSTSGRATPASAGAISVGSSACSSNSSHHQQQQSHQHYQQAQQQSYQYVTQTHNYFQRSQEVADGFPNYLHTFPSAATQSHYFQLQQQQQYPQCQQQAYAQQHLMSPHLQHSHQQQHSLPPIYATSHSVGSSPLLTKRATSFSGNMPMMRQQGECAHNTAAFPFQRSQVTAQSTPNSPRLMPRRQQKPPPIPAKPVSNLQSGSATTQNVTLKENAQVNPVSSLDGADAPWPHFSALTEYLDVHQVNNYGQGVPEINWQERCLELQLELHRSKNQAGRIRDMLREKLFIINIHSRSKETLDHLVNLIRATLIEQHL